MKDAKKSVLRLIASLRRGSSDGYYAALVFVFILAWRDLCLCDYSRFAAMRNRIVTFFLVSSLSCYSSLVVAGLTLSALAVIGAGALGVAGVMLVSPGLLTAAAFAGTAGLLCMSTSFCDAPVSPSTSPAPASSMPTAAPEPISSDAYGPRSFSAVCTALGGQFTVQEPGPSNYYTNYECRDASGNYLANVSGPNPILDGYCKDFNQAYEGVCAEPLPGLDGISLPSASPTAARLELPSVSSLPPGSYELWPGSGLYGKPGNSIIYDMREPTGEISGTAKTSLTEKTDGSKFLEIEVIGSANNEKMRIDVKPGGEKVVTVTRNVSVTDSAGNPDKLPTAVVSEYAPSGEKVSTSTFTNTSSTNNGPGPFTVADSEGGDGTPISTSPVPGAAPGEGTGSCVSGDCSTESTQLANKGLLQALKDFFTGTATNPDDPTARTGADVKGVSVDGSGVFTGLRGWQFPGHFSQCPTSSFAWNGNIYTFDAHCQLVTDHFAMFNGVMVLVFSISALFIVLRA